MLENIFEWTLMAPRRGSIWSNGRGATRFPFSQIETDRTRLTKVTTEQQISGGTHVHNAQHFATGLAGVEVQKRETRNLRVNRWLGKETVTSATTQAEVWFHREIRRGISQRSKELDALYAYSFEYSSFAWPYRALRSAVALLGNRDDWGCSINITNIKPKANCDNSG